MSRRNNKIISLKNYVAGWLDSSIHDFIEESFPSTFGSMEYALITCLDSNSDLASLFEENTEFKSLMAGARPLGRGLLLPTRKLLEVESRDQVFFGFDEVWFFPSEAIEPKPESGWLVGPARIDQKMLNKLEIWMSLNACSLAFGDGEGLNFIVKAAGLVRHLLGHSNNQPSPTINSAFEEDPVDGR